jgi:hypothetical protein
MDCVDIMCGGGERITREGAHGRGENISINVSQDPLLMYPI